MRNFEIVDDDFRRNETYPKLPQRATKSSAAYDFFSPVDITVQGHGSVMFWTDVKARMEPDEVLLLNVRSSMGKHPVMLSNTQGWIDSDYYGNDTNDGNIGIRLQNLNSSPYIIKKGDKIMQGMFVKYLRCDDDNCADETRTGGWGSTGK